MAAKRGQLGLVPQVSPMLLKNGLFECIGRFFDENADALDTEQREYAAMFLVTYVGTRLSATGVRKALSNMGIQIAYNWTRNEWDIMFAEKEDDET